MTASPRKVAIRGSVRKGPMPHNGYRPFDIAASRAAFPDFVYAPLAKGIAKAQGDATARAAPSPSTAGT